jgi:threonylcarbamoyladenosine tRNA methylthiotransferase MtaB
MSDKKLTVGIYTLGCKVNQYESEAVAEALVSHGFQILQPNEICDIYIINTCTVTAESDRKAGQFIRRAIAKNSKAYVIVMGCLSQTAPEEIAKIKGVDFICGNTRKLMAVDAALKFAGSLQKLPDPTIEVEDINNCPFESMSITRFDRTRAYVKIEDGCENRCTYCIIPKARGKVRSKDPAEVINEIKALVRGGCKEVVLTGIETASYGKDRKDTDLASLLIEADKIDGLDRIRLGSLDPSLMTERFVSKIAGLKSLAPHFHLSLQSGSDRILALMKRKYNSRMALEGIERIRKAIPNAMFTTDVIVGFPGENEEDFKHTEDFLKNARFLSAHIFAYSKRKGTIAAEMTDQIPKQTKSERSSKLISLQGEIRDSILRGEIGNEYSVLFETQTGDLAIGHTPSFIEVAVNSGTSIQGEIHRVRIIGVSNGIAEGIIV